MTYHNVHPFNAVTVYTARSDVGKGLIELIRADLQNNKYLVKNI